MTDSGTRLAGPTCDVGLSAQQWQGCLRRADQPRSVTLAQRYFKSKEPAVRFVPRRLKKH